MKWSSFILRAPSGCMIEVSHRCGEWDFPRFLAMEIVLLPPFVRYRGVMRMSAALALSVRPRYEHAPDLDEFWNENLALEVTALPIV